MVQAFEGETTQKVDKKGRMSIPAAFRGTLRDGDPAAEEGGPVRLKIVYGDHLENNVEVYTVDEHQRIKDEIYAMPREQSDDQELLSYLYVTQSTSVEVDKDGRAILPKLIRDKLGIEEGEIYFRGMVGKFEMWNNETFQSTVKADIRRKLAARGPGFKPLTMLKGGT